MAEQNPTSAALVTPGPIGVEFVRAIQTVADNSGCMGMCGICQCDTEYLVDLNPTSELGSEDDVLVCPGCYGLALLADKIGAEV